MSASTEALPIVPVVEIINDSPATTSLKIAECFEKQHKDVLESIRNLIAECPEDFNQRNFPPVEYTDAKGEKRPMYHVYFDGFMLLVMGFTGKKALAMKLAYIEEFNRMKAYLRIKWYGRQEEDRSELSPADRAELKAIVDAKLSSYPKEVQRPARMEIWCRFDRHFKIAAYAQLPPAKMAEARDYLIQMEVKALKPKPIEQEPERKSERRAYDPMFDTSPATTADIHKLRREFAKLEGKTQAYGDVIAIIYHAAMRIFQRLERPEA